MKQRSALDCQAVLSVLMPLAIGAGVPCLGIIFVSVNNSSSIFRCSCGWERLVLVISLFSIDLAPKKGPRLSRAKCSHENRQLVYPEIGKMQDEELYNYIQLDNSVSGYKTLAQRTSDN